VALFRDADAGVTMQAVVLRLTVVCNGQVVSIDVFPPDLLLKTWE